MDVNHVIVGMGQLQEEKKRKQNRVQGTEYLDPNPLAPGSPSYTLSGVGSSFQSFAGDFNNG